MRHLSGFQLPAAGVLRRPDSGRVPMDIDHSTAAASAPKLRPPAAQNGHPPSDRDLPAGKAPHLTQPRRAAPPPQPTVLRKHVYAGWSAVL